MNGVDRAVIGTDVKDPGTKGRTVAVEKIKVTVVHQIVVIAVVVILVTQLDLALETSTTVTAAMKIMTDGNVGVGVDLARGVVPVLDPEVDMIEIGTMIMMTGVTVEPVRMNMKIGGQVLAVAMIMITGEIAMKKILIEIHDAHIAIVLLTLVDLMECQECLGNIKDLQWECRMDILFHLLLCSKLPPCTFLLLLPLDMSTVLLHSMRLVNNTLQTGILIPLDPCLLLNRVHINSICLVEAELQTLITLCHPKVNSNHIIIQGILDQ
mmetsp:Transcript_20427/g.19645  ORF Transcript_20427/g.19645 Transcript_20427/m.19645 type:complete len:267 (-) Transcript_20427:761-1561(-)